MTAEWRTLRADEVDHERLWAAVIGACAVVVTALWQSAGLPSFRCVFKAVTGLPCLTCGCGRAVAALLDGDLLAAAWWNPLVPAAAATALVYGPYAAVVAIAGLPRLRVRVGARDARAARWIVLAASAILWSWLYIEGR